MHRPKDIAVATVLALPDMSAWTDASLAVRLELSASDAHALRRTCSLRADISTTRFAPPA